MSTADTVSSGSRRWTSKNLFDTVFETLPDGVFLDFGPETLMERRGMESMNGKEEEGGMVTSSVRVESKGEMDEGEDAYVNNLEKEEREKDAEHQSGGDSHLWGSTTSSSSLSFTPSPHIQRLAVSRVGEYHQLPQVRIPFQGKGVGVSAARPYGGKHVSLSGIRLEVDLDRAEDEPKTEKKEEDEEEVVEEEEGKAKRQKGHSQPGCSSTSDKTSNRHPEDKEEGKEEEREMGNETSKEGGVPGISQERNEKTENRGEVRAHSREDGEGKMEVEDPLRASLLSGKENKEGMGEEIQKGHDGVFALSSLMAAGRRENLTADEQMRRMPPGRSALYEGVCVTVQMIKGFGFISPQIGGPDIYFTCESVRLTFTRLVLFCYAVQHQQFPLPNTLMRDVTPPTALFSSFPSSFPSHASGSSGGDDGVREGWRPSLLEKSTQQEEKGPKHHRDQEAAGDPRISSSFSSHDSHHANKNTMMMFKAIQPTLHHWQRSYEAGMAASPLAGKRAIAAPLPPPTWQEIETAWGVAAGLSSAAVSLLRWHVELMVVPYIASAHRVTFTVQRNRLTGAHAKRLLKAEQIRGLASTCYATVEEQAWFCDAFPGAIGHKHYPPPSPRDLSPESSSSSDAADVVAAPLEGQEDGGSRNSSSGEEQHYMAKVEGQEKGEKEKEEEMGRSTVAKEERGNGKVEESQAARAAIPSTCLPPPSTMISPITNPPKGVVGFPVSGRNEDKEVDEQKDTKKREKGEQVDVLPKASASNNYRNGTGAMEVVPTPLSGNTTSRDSPVEEEGKQRKEEEGQKGVSSPGKGAELSSLVATPPPNTRSPSRMLERYVGYIRMYNQDLQKGYIACDEQEIERVAAALGAGGNHLINSGPRLGYQSNQNAHPSSSASGVGLPDVIFSFNSVLLLPDAPRRLLCERLQVRYSVCAIGPHNKYVASLVTGIDDEPLSEANATYVKPSHHHRHHRGGVDGAAYDAGDASLDGKRSTRGKDRQEGRRGRRWNSSSFGSWRDGEDNSDKGVLSFGTNGKERAGVGRNGRGRGRGDEDNDDGSSGGTGFTSVAAMLQEMYVGGEDDSAVIANEGEYEEEEEALDANNIIDPSYPSSPFVFHIDRERKRGRGEMHGEGGEGGWRGGSGGGGPPYAGDEGGNMVRRRGKYDGLQQEEGGVLNLSGTSALNSSDFRSSFSDSSALTMGGRYSGRSGVLHDGLFSSVGGRSALAADMSSVTSSISHTSTSGTGTAGNHSHSLGHHSTPHARHTNPISRSGAGGGIGGNPHLNERHSSHNISHNNIHDSDGGVVREQQQQELEEDGLLLFMDDYDYEHM